MLIHFGVVPYLVFDGDYLPSKSVTEVGRASRREESRKLGLELHRLGKISQSQNELQKAVDVTPEMARQLIEELKKHGVQYVVAPYEADAQLAYLERKGLVTGILSEDSDLLVFGAKCLLTKLDQYGDCIEINRDDFTACREISLVGWSDSEFRLMAILSGCDYLANIDKMGLKTAYRLIRKYKDIEKIIRMLAFDGKFHVPPGYLESFRKAELTFLHQRVFCPILNDMVMMTSLGARPEPDDFAFIGGRVPQEIAVGVARGDLHPMTKKPILVQDRVKRTTMPPTSGVQMQSGVKFSDLKGNHSIESFFKAKRTPLAELDPNSFTPSPSQHLLLQTTNTTWVPQMAPTTPLLPRPGVLTDASAVIPGRMNQRINAGAVGQSQLIPNSAKRRRLCLEVEAEEDTLDQPSKQESGPSRFFKPVPDPKPSVKDKPSTKRGTRTEINIWSDDSVEDVMAGLPDLSECHDQVKKGKLKIFRDEVPKVDSNLSFGGVSDDSSVRVDSQLSVTSKATTESNTSVSSLSTECSKSSQSLPHSKNDEGGTRPIALSHFSYQAESQDSLSRQCHLESKGHIASSLSNVITKPKLDRKRSMTPLERLGAGALSRSNSCNYPVNSTLASSATSKSIKIAPKRPENTLLKPQMTEHPVCRIRGSEDQIIPDSEEEYDSTNSEADAESHRKTKPDFARFAFVA